MHKKNKPQHHACLLIDVFCDLYLVERLTLPEIDLLIRQARRSDVLGKLAMLLEESDMLAKVPEKPRSHFMAAKVITDKHEQIMKWEIKCIHEALKNTGIPYIFLKGAAYVILDLPSAKGRIYADVDIMVPRESILNIEKELLLCGWASINLDSYDQRYYRKWMHEIPPLRNRRRQTVIDVHHRILPVTTRAQPDPVLMMENSVIAAETNVATLAPTDIIIHCSVHLFYEGEFDHGFRDLLDLRDLFTCYGTKKEFWDEVIERADILDSNVPLYYAIHYCNIILKMSVPNYVWQHEKLFRPNRYQSYISDFLFLRALVPYHRSCNSRLSYLAKSVLYIRSHYIRMPLYLLVPHLLRKAFYKKDK